MGQKVYWITLGQVLYQAKNYIQRNDIKLQQNLDTAQYNCVKAVLTAILDCLALLPTNNPVV